MGRFHLPMSHRPAMQVPKGGSNCANCRFYSPEASPAAPHGQCGEPNFKRFYSTTAIPCPPDQFCSDWYEPATLLALC